MNAENETVMQMLIYSPRQVRLYKQLRLLRSVPTISINLFAQHLAFWEVLLFFVVNF